MFDSFYSFFHSFIHSLFHSFFVLNRQAAGIPPTELADVPPTALLHGFGLKVCRLLNLLADRALISSAHKWIAFNYGAVGSADVVPAEGSDNEDGDNIIADEV